MVVYKKSAETKQKIINATIELVLKKGYHYFTVKDISDLLEIPRSLIYYYYKNKDDIMYDIYKLVVEKIEAVTQRITVAVEDPLVTIMVKYILHFRFAVQNDLLQDFIFSRPTYVSEGRDVIIKAIDTCYFHCKQAFNYYKIPLNNNTLFTYVITSDALIHALFEGLANGIITMSLRETIMYFGERTVMVSFDLTRKQFSEIVSYAFDLTDPIKSI